MQPELGEGKYSEGVVELGLGFAVTALAGDRGLLSLGSCNSSDRLPLSPFPGQSGVGERFAPTLPAGIFRFSKFEV